MRSFLIALMIVMLPVHGWMGDATAIGMAGLQRGAVSAPLAHEMTSFHEDSAGMPMSSMSAGATNGPSDDEAPGGVAGFESCSLCQVCNTVALTVDASLGLAPPATQMSPIGVLPYLASAHLRRGHKPPIS